MSTRLSARGKMAKNAWALGFGLIVAMFACMPLQRHAVLDFVVDGVPPYRTPEEKALEAAAAAQREAEAPLKEPRRGSKRHLKKLARFTHGPFAAKECTRCHDLTTASGFRDLSGGGDARATAELAEEGRLRMPVDELCVHCHTDFTQDAPANEGLSLHGPVASGWCVLCHEPHSARYPALLALDPTARLCSRCHVREDLVRTFEHRPIEVEDAFPPVPASDTKEPETDTTAISSDSVIRVVRDCTRCHDPHMGPDRLLLRPRQQWMDASTIRDGTTNPDLSQEHER